MSIKNANQSFIDSLDVASLTGTRHSNVLRKIKEISSELNEHGFIRANYITMQGKRCIKYEMNLKSSMILLSTYGAALRSEILDAYSIRQLIMILENFDFGDIRERYLYAAKDGDGRIKIGISKNPEERIKSLNVGHPDKLEICFVKKTESSGYKDETDLHNKLSDFHIRSEWFNPEALPIE